MGQNIAHRVHFGKGLIDNILKWGKNFLEPESSEIDQIILGLFIAE